MFVDTIANCLSTAMIKGWKKSITKSSRHFTYSLSIKSHKPTFGLAVACGACPDEAFTVVGGRVQRFYRYGGATAPACRSSAKAWALERKTAIENKISNGRGPSWMRDLQHD